MQETLKTYLVNECNLLADKMLTAKNQRDAIYYFSALYSACQRVFNIEFSREILRIFVVGYWGHQALTSRFQQQSQTPLAQMLTPEIPQGHLELLAEGVRALGERISKDEDFQDVLDTIATLCYASTGNGYYLYETGKIE